MVLGWYIEIFLHHLFPCFTLTFTRQKLTFSDSQPFPTHTYMKIWLIRIVKHWKKEEKRNLRNFSGAAILHVLPLSVQVEATRPR